MSNTKSSGGQSSKGFLHWLKNTWLGRFWNWIVSYFRPKNKKTESQSASAEQAKVVNDDDNNDQSKSSEVGQEKDRESSQSREKVREDVQKEDSDLPQTPINSKSPAMLRSRSEPSLNSIALSGLPTNRLLRSQSLNDLSQASIDSELEWDDSDLNPTSSQPEQKGTRGVQRKNVGTYDFKYDDHSQKSILLNSSASSTLSKDREH